jgi:hypothetical protein
MTTKFKIYGTCFNCRKKRLFVRVRQLLLPVGLKAMGRDLLCTRCYTQLQEAVTAGHIHEQ